MLNKKVFSGIKSYISKLNKQEKRKLGISLNLKFRSPFSESRITATNKLASKIFYYHDSKLAGIIRHQLRHDSNKEVRKNALITLDSMLENLSAWINIFDKKTFDNWVIAGSSNVDFFIPDYMAAINDPSQEIRKLAYEILYKRLHFWNLLPEPDPKLLQDLLFYPTLTYKGINYRYDQIPEYPKLYIRLFAIKYIEEKDIKDAPVLRALKYIINDSEIPAEREFASYIIN